MMETPVPEDDAPTNDDGHEWNDPLGHWAHALITAGWCVIPTTKA